ncbi:MAG TPA: hypothetical protein VN914_21195, partial [Polyangia bacterium]|nr:hypothetical protein [Polyangia bacterium]
SSRYARSSARATASDSSATVKGFSTTACKVDQSMKTCGGGDCTNWSCTGTPPDMNTCDIHN